MGYLTLTNPVTLPSSFCVDYGGKEIFVSESGTMKAYFNGQPGGYSHLKFDGNLNDSSGKVWTAYGGAMVSGNQKKFGGSALYLNGSQYITTPGNTDFEFGGSDFTVDFWFYTAINARQWFIHSTTDYWFGIDYYSTPAKKLGLWASSNGTSWNMINADSGGNGICATTLPQNQWNHIAATRSGNVWRVFLNGVRDLEVTVAGNILDRSSQTKYIGSWAGGAQYIVNGYIDEFRITKGKALWTSNFMPPTRGRNLHTSPLQEIYIPGNAPDYILIQSSAISATEALTRARTGRPKDMNNILVHLKPNELTSDYKVLDVSGNGNNATLTGGTFRKVMK